MTKITTEIENNLSLKLHQTWQVGCPVHFIFCIDCVKPTTNKGHLIHQSVSGWGRSRQQREEEWWRRIGEAG